MCSALVIKYRNAKFLRGRSTLNAEWLTLFCVQNLEFVPAEMFFNAKFFCCFFLIVAKHFFLAARIFFSCSKKNLAARKNCFINISRKNFLVSEIISLENIVYCNQPVSPNIGGSIALKHSAQLRKSSVACLF